MTNTPSYNFFFTQVCDSYDHVTGYLEVTITGNSVAVQRPPASDGNACTYTGTLASDNIHVSGSYTCSAGFTGPWSATISR